MLKNLLVDTAKIDIRAGNGGDGKVSFRREKYIPYGGPDGGDGGNGGSVFILADENMATLRDFRAKTSYAAQDGEEGGKKKMSGAGGEDLVIKVPSGTLVYQIEEDGREILVGDLIAGSEPLLIASGGKGGKGNEKFKSSTNQTPLQFTKGTLGDAKTLKFEVKLIADVGLIGFPNAGKSTLINKLAGTNAKVANYPFTTLSPNLGVVKLKSGKDAVFADIPGLIEGASEGKGLGDDFLRHIERTRLIVHLIDPTEIPEVEDIVKAYEVIRNELKNYGKELDSKKEIVVINKVDVLDVAERFDIIAKAFEGIDVEVLGISALTGKGLEELLVKIMQGLDKIPNRPIFEVKKPTKVFTINDLPNRRVVFRGNKL